MIRRRGRVGWVISVACVCTRICACICGSGEVRGGGWVLLAQEGGNDTR